MTFIYSHNFGILFLNHLAPQAQRRMHFQINGKSASCARALKTFKLGKLVFDIFTIYNFLPQNEEEVKGNTLVGSFAFCFGIHLYF